MRNIFVAVVSLLVMCGAALGAVTVSVSSPANNYSGASPIRMIASATSSNGMSSMAIFVDGTRIYFNWGSSLTAYVWMTAGTHTVLVQGTDNTGLSGSKQLSLTATTSGGTVSNIDDWAGWQNCTAANCAGGNGTSTTWTAANQSSPSRDGASREFYLGGTPGYSNAYWYKLVGGSASVTNFTYDFWFYVDKPKVPQAVEFDVNQSFSQKRWVFGTECNVATGV